MRGAPVTIVMRGYQDDLIGETRNAIRTYDRVLVQASTGAGKTRMFAKLSDLAAAKGKRVLILAHRVEIIEQISRALAELGLRHGLIVVGRRMTDDPVQLGMIQTVGRRLDRVAPPSLIVVDECHHAVSPTYVAVLNHWPKAKLLGFTATPRRADGRGLGDVFQTMVQAIPMADLIKQGFLAGYDYLAPPMKADLSGVKTRMGDFAVDELAAVMDKQVVTGSAVDHYAQHLQGRPAIAFCVTVAHAEHVAQQFREARFRAASVDGAMDQAERRNRIDAIGNGELQVLTSCELISEGVDVPVVAGAILLRPTKSLGMFLQQVGRCLRPKPDGSKAVILDHVGNVHNHGMPDAHREWSLETKRKKAGAAPTAVCKACFRVFAVSPGWKDAADPCEADDPDCILTWCGGVKEAPEQVAGELAVVVPSPDWARGLSLTGAKGAEWRRLLGYADTREKLSEIGIARGYKASWAWWQWRERQNRRPSSPNADMPFQPAPAAPPPAKRSVSMFDDVVTA